MNKGLRIKLCISLFCVVIAVCSICCLSACTETTIVRAYIAGDIVSFSSTSEMFSFIPEKRGYSFDGWVYYVNNEPVKVTQDSLPDEKVVFHATWKIEEYTASFYADGVQVGTSTYTIEQKPTMPAVPEKNGYSTAWEEHEFTTGDVTINAIYTPLTYSITYEEVKEAENPNALTYTIESGIVLEPLFSDDYTFLGWYEEDQLVTEIQVGEYGNRTLTARWERIPKYYIYFYTGDKATQVEAMTGIKAGEPIKAPEEPRGICSKFMGWFTDNGTFQTQFVFDKMPANNVSLYAKWESTIDDNDLVAYENSLDENSENGHLYIHYMRFDNNPEEYAKWSLWIWPNVYAGKTFNWKTDDNGNVLVDEFGGAVCDIDLTKFYADAGTDGTETMQFFIDGAYGENYKPEYIKDPSKYLEPKIGFLIVYDESKNFGTHWKSDGGNQYFVIATSVRENGSIHIFATQDNVGDFVFSLS